LSNQSLPLQELEMLLQIIAQQPILMSIGIEDLDRSRRTQDQSTSFRARACMTSILSAILAEIHADVQIKRVVCIDQKSRYVEREGERR